jgi:3-methyladenine DNA glycosylase AlkD
MDVDALVDLAGRRLAAAANPAKAKPMAAYMKTGQPFYGVQKPARTPILRELVTDFPPADRDEYRAAVLALWNQPHREEQYLAIGYAKAFPRYVTLSSVPLYRRLVVEGAWWDLVDDVAISLIGTVLVNQRVRMTPKVRAWIGDPDLWLRRTSIIVQVGRKDAVDERLLFEACAARLDETEFFIRKAIGWALRDYAWTNPDAVEAFVTDHRDEMSGLSFREATKHLAVSA